MLRRNMPYGYALAGHGYLAAHSSDVGSSPGIDSVRWLKPVYPGDQLTLKVETLEVRPSRNRPEMGAVQRGYVCLNQHDEPVMTMEGIGLFATRPGA